MDKEMILIHELTNDGRSIFLYYDDMVGLYLAFGQSAYYTILVTRPYISFSYEMQMPVALLKRDNILYLRQSMKKVEHEKKKFYRFELKQYVGKEGYEKWAKKIWETVK